MRRQISLLFALTLLLTNIGFCHADNDEPDYDIRLSANEKTSVEKNNSQGDISRCSLELQTNALAWFMFVSNVGINLDINNKWSISVPIYYSGVNYFTGKTKFRILGTLPEIRYFFHSTSSTGFFTGAHFGIARYNFAIGGKYRFQDMDANTPAIGGGLTVGYRLSMSKNRRWNCDFSLGCGYYHLHTDHFSNVPNGDLIYTSNNNKVLIDNVGIAITYIIPL